MPQRLTSFVRFTTARRNDESGYQSGLFIAAWTVQDEPTLCGYERDQLSEHLDWFSRHLLEPSRFCRSRSKGAADRNWRGLSWFKPSATEHINRMRAIAAIVGNYGWPAKMIRSARPGFIVYEDDFQVVAEPFADTPLS